MIINGYEEYNDLLERLNREPYVVTPIFRDVFYHKVENGLLCVGVMFENRDAFTVSISHDDADKFSMGMDIFHHSHAFTSDKVNALSYIHGRKLPELNEFFSPYVRDVLAHFGNMVDSNRIIPITLWASALTRWNTLLWNTIDEYKNGLDSPAYTFTTSLIGTLKRIERAGLAVNKSILSEKFGDKVLRWFKNDKVYSEYNPFTTTGRPSNRYGGINFSALNKTDGTRAAFISRYENGCLVQLDFEAYHLRLIAKEYGIPLPSGSLHTEMAKKYFDTDTITDELYAASKQKTFEIMYGMSDDTYGINLFERVVELRKNFKEITDTLVLPSGVSIHIEEPNPSKLFNYHVQSLEVVRTLPKLQKVLDMIENTDNHLVLYTYDSILLDVKEFDTALIDNIKNILEEEKAFPVRTFTGTTYDNLQEL